MSELKCIKLNFISKFALTAIMISVFTFHSVIHANEKSGTGLGYLFITDESEYGPTWENGIFGHNDSFGPDIDLHYNLGNNCSRPGSTSNNQKFGTYLNRICLSLKDESVIADALSAAAYDTYVVLTGRDVIVMDKEKYSKWKQQMANSLLKIADGTTSLLILVPAKLATGAVLTIVGAFAVPFESKNEVGYRFRSGVGLLLKSVGTTIADVTAIVSGLTLGLPSYLIANIGPNGKRTFTEVTEFPSP